MEPPTVTFLGVGRLVAIGVLDWVYEEPDSTMSVPNYGEHLLELAGHIGVFTGVEPPGDDDARNIKGKETVQCGIGGSGGCQ